LTDVKAYHREYEWQSRLVHTFEHQILLNQNHFRPRLLVIEDLHRYSSGVCRISHQFIHWLKNATFTK
jgi:hypothetical protein